MKRADYDMTTILPQAVQDAVKGKNCFDFLRYFFAVMLIVAHFCTLTGIDQIWYISGGLRVKAFFVITGFLVTYSFIRRNADLKSYLIKRFVRIVPAYLCAIAFCFLLGLWLTEWPLRQFITSPDTWKYLISNALMLNWLQPGLPGVFQSNPLPQMDGSLWSMKQEVIFYLLVPILMALVIKLRKRTVLISLFVIITLSYSFLPTQGQYFTFFFGGMTVLLCFEHHQQLKYGLLAAVAVMILNNMIDNAWLNTCLGSLEPYLFAMALVGVAYLLSFLHFFRRLDNITYGLYLYHFPVAQVFIHFRLHEYSLPLTFLLTLLTTICLATLSWKWIEQPLMNKYK